MKNRIFKPFVFATNLLLIVLLALFSCNDPTLIGSDVIGSDQVDVRIETLEVQATTVSSPPIQVYNSVDISNAFFSHLLGEFDDPVFGESTASLFAQLRYGQNGLGVIDSIRISHFEDANSVIDSVVFVLQLDTFNFYGNEMTPQTIEVYELTEPMNNNDVYFSDQSFSFGNLLGSRTSVSFDNFDDDNSYWIHPTTFDTIRTPLVSIPLNIDNTQFKDSLFRDSTSLRFFNQIQDDTVALPDYLNLFRGIAIKAFPSNPGDPDLMLSTRIVNSEALNLSTLTGLYVCTSSIGPIAPDTTTHPPIAFRFPITSNSPRVVNFEHDQTGSYVEDFISTTPTEYTGDSLMFVQGMQGVNVKLRLPNVTDLGNVIINKAELEVFSGQIDEDIIPLADNPINQLVIMKLDSDGEFEEIADVNEGLRLGNLEGVFGGNSENISENSDILYSYKMNITSHLQEIIDGVEPSNEIYIVPEFKGQRSSRAVLFGPNHPDHPLKLTVTYTINQ